MVLGHESCGTVKGALAERVLLSFVPEKIYAFDVSLGPVALGEVYQMRALRTKNVHSQA
jgi:hypothetical protein